MEPGKKNCPAGNGIAADCGPNLRGNGVPDAGDIRRDGKPHVQRIGHGKHDIHIRRHGPPCLDMFRNGLPIVGMPSS